MSEEHQGPALQTEADTGLACLIMLARFHNVAASPEQLAHEYLEKGRHFGRAELLLASKQLGLKAHSVRSKIERLPHLPLPAIAVSVDGDFFIIAQLDGEKALIHDPRSARPEVVTFEDLKGRWSWELVLVRSQASLAAELAKFDFTWFIPAVVKYRKLLGEVIRLYCRGRC
ncbi:cysteine peptidase family C39 domain-containing protein [Pseudomonas turukhanskensis]|uniref:Peptidase C39 domain-containing protein n=1 Tax=Pseudomonas turukhanskensis TaxID=1806536 RepID=A0A9W6K872_9PSED|nr:cysteine peptidase family C39 domain-containing protein [Pseudomonas turukhanskensis]GLK91231.1 hypothetical protein GCM10017655_42950 [Pseudomonas turukhanskensis]